MTGVVFFVCWCVSCVAFCLWWDRRRNGYWGLDLDGEHRRQMERIRRS